MTKTLIAIALAAAALALPAGASASQTAHIARVAPGHQLSFAGDDCLVRAEVRGVSVVASAKEKPTVTPLSLGKGSRVKVSADGNDRITVRNVGKRSLRVSIVVDGACAGGSLSAL